MKNKKIIIPFIIVIVAILIGGAAYILNNSFNEIPTPSNNVNEGPRKDEQKESNESKEDLKEKELENDKNNGNNSYEQSSNDPIEPSNPISNDNPVINTKPSTGNNSNNIIANKPVDNPSKDEKPTEPEKKPENPIISENPVDKPDIPKEPEEPTKTPEIKKYIFEELIVLDNEDISGLGNELEEGTIYTINSSIEKINEIYLMTELKEDEVEFIGIYVNGKEYKEKTITITKDTTLEYRYKTIKKEENEEKTEDIILMPSNPIIVSAHASENSITINFLPSQNATGYTCSANGKDGIITSLIDNNLQCNISSLQEGTSYKVELKAINKDKEAIVTTTIKTEYLTPGDINLISLNATVDEIYANFNKVENAKTYICLYKENSEDNYISTPVTIIDDTVYCNIKNLKEHTKYNLMLKAISGDKEKFSDKLTLETTYKTPEKPIILNIEKTLTSINIETNIPNNSTNIYCKYGESEDLINNNGIVEKQNDKYICKMSNLDVNKEYFIKLTSTYKDVTFVSLDTIKLSTNDYNIPSQPILASSSSNVDSIEVTFGVSDNAQEYEIYFGKDKNDLKKYDISVSEDGLNRVFDKLDASSEYFFKLIAINGTKQTSSEIYSIMTKDLKPDEPKLISSSMTSNSISLNFEPSKNAKSYACYYGTSDANINFLAETTINESSIQCNLNTLNQNTDYFIRLTAINNNERSDSEIIKIKTSYETPEKPILNSNKWERSSDSLMLTYTKPNYATTYTCYYGEDSNNLNNSVVGNVIGNEVSCNIGGLKEGTVYYVKLFVTNEFQTSNESSVVSFKTDFSNPDKPMLESVDSSYNSITANYIVGRDDLMYVCYYSRHNSEIQNQVTANIVNGYAQCYIPNLDEYTEYDIMLAAVNVTKTTVSDVVTATTKYKTPEKPVLLSKTAKSDSVILKYNNVNENYEYTCRYGSSIDAITNIGNIRFEDGALVCEIDNLLEKKDYYVSLTAINGNETVEAEVQTITTKYNTPSKPYLISTESGSNYISSVFSKSDYATDYVCYYGEEDINNIGTVTVNDYNVECNISNLKQNTDYQVKLMVSNNNEIFVESDIVNIKTDYKKPVTPILQSSEKYGNSIVAIYEADSDVENMACKYGSDSELIDKDANIVINDNGTVSCTASNLTENTSYYFKLILKNGQYTVSSTIDTINSELKRPGKSSLISSESRFYEIIAKFKLTENTDRYICYAGSSSDNLNMSVNASIIDDKVSCSFDNLSKGTKYYVQVESIRGSLITKSDVYEISTEGDTVTPATFVESDAYYDRAYASWILNGTYTDNKCLIGTDRNNINTVASLGIHGENAYCFANNLEPNTTYYVKLLTTNDTATAEQITTIKTSIANPVTASQIPYSKAIPALFINNSSGAELDDADYTKALNILNEQMKVELLSVIDELNTTKASRSVGDWSVYYTEDNKIGAFYIHVVLYDDNNNATGSYYVKSDGTRQWIERNGF